MYAILRNKMSGIKHEVVDCARSLINTPSVSLHEGNMARLLEDTMHQLDFDQVTRDDFGNITGILFGRNTDPAVLLLSHMDTVDVARAPVSNDQHPDRLYGIGAADCKAGIAAQLYTVELLKRSLLPLRGTVVVSATVAEQNGCSVGSRHLLAETLPALGIKPSYAIMAEPTNLGLYYGHDGWVELEIHVEGPRRSTVNSTTQSLIKDLNSFNPGTPYPESNSEPIGQPEFSMNGDHCQARFKMTHRLPTTESAQNFVSQVQHEANMISAKNGVVSIDVQVAEQTQTMFTTKKNAVKNITHAWSTDPFHPLLDRSRQALQAAGCEVRPGKWQLGRPGMGTSGGVLVKEFDIPTIGYGPGNEDCAHTPGEYVEKEKIVQAVYGTAAIVHSLAGIPVFGWSSDEI